MNSKAIKIFLLGLFFAGVAYVGLKGTPAKANSGGPPSSRTGAPMLGSFSAELNCGASGCHQGNPINAAGGTFTITGLPAYYLPDQEFTVTVTLNRANRSLYGFQLTVLDASGNRAGTLTVTDSSRTSIVNGGTGFTTRRYIQHTGNGITPNGTNQNSWSFKWKAPSAPAGKITMYAAGNAADGSFTSSGDFIYTTSASIDPLPFGAVSAASFVPGNTLTSEMIGSIFSVGMASGVFSSVLGQPLPTQLGGTEVEVEDAASTTRVAPLFFVAPEQINFLVPQNTPEGQATVKVKRSGDIVAIGTTTVVKYSPGIFAANGDAKGIAAAQILRFIGQQYTNESVAQFNTNTVRWEPLPIDLGPDTNTIYLVLYGTGIRGISSLSAATVTVGGQSLPVLYAGAQLDYQGLDQVNVGPIPRSFIGRGPVDIVFSGDGKTSNTVSVTIK